ncbi:phenylalanyl-tRNA synthetase, alpha subunit [Candidatus Endolissoclinum faulkneri L2]|uniref:Phenylalanine--tRNA ligase alpha subunit n=1 Tax=Candidatus Endolissoclinum faulkneri L2 TaxID=1193729 RepID=K7YS02_9PROT|nr:phenylalanine--tRNA ligase subunit alpha [Candidatus Endolissoclinum faulkneri]AFX99324.1 phenylalanyl-tRNA synthetase, alpha subunit [Candidatus Endolissoclinum faulkneri L2]
MFNIKALETELLARIARAEDLDSLEQIRIFALGKKGRITTAMSNLAGMNMNTRKKTGKALNSLKCLVKNALVARKIALSSAILNNRIVADRVDISLPAPPEMKGRIHPITQTTDEIVTIFAEMGFVVVEGPDIESDYYNFEALNFTPDHPARQDQDTLYLKPDKNGKRKVLRTHTSPVQIRTMEKQSPPIRIIVPGRTFRSDHDATHSPMFHQLEGLVVDKVSHMGHLKGCLIDFCHAFFSIKDLPLRFRPSYFPFTEPSAELDIGCLRIGTEVKIGDYGNWLEILGCGMVHPNVLHNSGINPNKYQGFAFGIGIERVSMLKYGIPDLRPFYESNLRWMRHYGFLSFAQPTIAGGV